MPGVSVATVTVIRGTNGGSGWLGIIALTLNHRNGPADWVTMHDDVCQDQDGERISMPAPP